MSKLSAYLDIAEDVLRLIRRPLSATEILKFAYENKLVPHHLFGATQHKTLQARLSEHILRNRESSVFYRTEPGRFLLTEFLTDESIDEKYREPMIARRRTRDLATEPAAYIPCEINKGIDHEIIDYDTFDISDTRRHFLWSFSVVTNGTCVLSYRTGKYREQSETFLNKRTIGFVSLIYQSHRTLFNYRRDNIGICESAFEAVAYDLDITSPKSSGDVTTEPEILDIIFSDTGHAPAYLAVVKFHGAKDLDNSTRRLSLNNLEWIDMRVAPNHLDGFDPWSKEVIQELRLKIIDEQESSDRAVFS